ncbi:hypothetical protein Glove_503g8 [Diversispora epigaea]|uniref:Uncharacterized protein n=1 Tax=Diversispora epigaea TaxID=1348612 RepID=A0A397GL70_9GLOM|nr:hypothetical protein Glove_503g8 [Diversispora epigaea]
MKRIFSKLDNLQKMLEKIMKNQEKIQNDIKSVKEEVAILSYDQDCVYVSDFHCEIILNPNNENIKISEKIIKPVLLKNLNKIENNKSFEYESDSPKRLEVAPKRLVASKKLAVSERPAAPRNEKNDDDDNEADEGDKAYEANEAYKGDEYYNEIINIDESCRIMIYSSITLKNGTILCIKNDRSWFSNIAVNINEEELFEYLLDKGICYAQTLLITEIRLPNKLPLHFALIQWYNFMSEETLFVYDCLLLLRFQKIIV